MNDLELREQVAIEVMAPEAAQFIGQSGGKLAWIYGGDTKFVPAYEEDIEAAFEVLDKIINDHDGTLEVGINMLFPASGDAPHIEVCFHDFWGYEENAVGYGCSTQEAICKAALAAVRARKQPS